MAFRNLHLIEFNIKRKVGLTENEVIMLASAWPQMEHLYINPDWGWSCQKGITPAGLLCLLQICRSFSRIALVLDVQGYIETSPDHVPASLRSTLPPRIILDVLDSVIG